MYSRRGELMNTKYWERFLETGYISDYLEYKISGKADYGLKEKQAASDGCQNFGENDIRKNNESGQPEFTRQKM